MHINHNWLGAAALGLVMATGLALPTLAQTPDNSIEATTPAEVPAAEPLEPAADEPVAVEAEPAPEVEAAPEADAAALPDFGDDSGYWVNDGECDDPRFEGEDARVDADPADLMKDASDCRTAFEAGTITLRSEGWDDVAVAVDVADIDFGDDTSEWANDAECDDPRFEGPGVAGQPTNADIFKDATDCRAAYEDGSATLRVDADDIVAAANEVDYGNDFSRWAEDGECDDKRFTGPGMAKKLLPEDVLSDATDCRALVEEGAISIIPVFDPAYAAAAPHDASGIDFGDNTSSYADDQQCDDPRFIGPGVATNVVAGDFKHDRNDCKAAFVAGTAILE